MHFEYGWISVESLQERCFLCLRTKKNCIITVMFALFFAVGLLKYEKKRLDEKKVIKHKQNWFLSYIFGIRFLHFISFSCLRLCFFHSLKLDKDESINDMWKKLMITSVALYGEYYWSYESINTMYLDHIFSILTGNLDNRND